jgi:hypothetical protein
MTARAGALAAALAAAGCFSPEAREGLPCSEAGTCPPGQSCESGVCQSEPPVADAAAGGEGAAGADAAPAEVPGPFGAVEPVVLTCPGPVTCADVRDPFLNADLTAILFTYGMAVPMGNQDLYVATRLGTGPFARASSVGAINTGLAEHTPFLSADGNSLWFARQDVTDGIETRPYDEILVSVRESGPFDAAQPVAGGVNTALGDERSPQVFSGGGSMLFTRSAESALGDHDVYLARFEGGQWNTIERLAALSNQSSDERSLAVVEERRAIFFIRDDQIHEVIWSAEDPSSLEAHVVHDELDVAPIDLKLGVWSSADGNEVWFDSNRSGAQQIYRAVRTLPTRTSSSGGRIRRRPIP